MITDIAKFHPHQHVAVPYKHQLDTFERTRSWKYYGLFWEMGVGKSKPLIDTAAWLFLNGEIDGVIIMSDKGAYLNWPIEEIPKHLQQNILDVTRIGIWKSSANSKEQIALAKLLEPKDDVLDVLCMNVEALSSDRAQEFAESFIRSHYTMIIIDEATSIKNPKAKRTLNAIALGRKCDYRRIATGTPITQGPLDLYAMCEFLDQGLSGHNSFTSFKSAYAITLEIVNGRQRFQKIIGYKNLEVLKSHITQFSSRITKMECLDLPEKIYETLYVELSPEQRKIYEQLCSEAIAEFDGGVITSLSGLTTMEKLHQVCCGHIKDDDGTIRDLAHDRLSVLSDEIEKLENGEKFIVWCHYQRDVEQVINHLNNKESGILGKNKEYAVAYYGKSTPDERMQALQNFGGNKLCRGFVGTAATGGKGLTLNVAWNVFYYSRGFKLEHRLQSEDRNHRIGQKNNVIYKDLVAPDSVEVRILASLKAKKNIADEILDQRRLLALLSGF
jgi:SNF2 family DNA or RNA helicase